MCVCVCVVDVDVDVDANLACAMVPSIQAAREWIKKACLNGMRKQFTHDELFIQYNS